jgi:hypothetical protein
MVKNSSHWVSNLEELCDGFYNKCLNKKHISRRANNFRVIDECCDKRIDKIKNEVYPDHIEKDVCLLDRHKIITAYIQCFLRNPVFVKESTVFGNSAFDLLANEYYCYLVLRAIIDSWPCNKAVGKKLNIPKDYRDCLLKLFYKYKNTKVLHTDDTTFNYALASIVYFVERCFLV